MTPRRRSTAITGVVILLAIAFRVAIPVIVQLCPVVVFAALLVAALLPSSDLLEALWWVARSLIMVVVALAITILVAVVSVWRASGRQS
jgi:hypothetical protein